MIVKVVLFAMAKELAGEREIEIKMAESSTVGDLKRCLIESYPSVGELVARSAISVDHEFAVDAQVLDQGSEVALIPPVSGG
jgi:molybdopterin converting factor subunit 1